MEFGNSILLLLLIDIVHAFKSVHKVNEDFDNDICWSDGWLCDVFVFEEDGVRKAGAVHGTDETFMFVIVFGGGTDTPTIHRMFSHCVTALGLT